MRQVNQHMGLRLEIADFSPNASFRMISKIMMSDVAPSFPSLDGGRLLRVSRAVGGRLSRLRCVMHAFYLNSGWGYFVSRQRGQLRKLTT